MMKRILATGMAAAVTAGLFVVNVAPLGAQPSPKVSPILRPPSGQTAVKPGDPVTLDGEAEPGATLVEAKIHQLDASGNVVGQVYTATDQTRLEGGRIRCNLNEDGRCFTLWTLDSEADVVQYVVTVQAGGETHTGGSNLVPVDLARPNIARYEVVRNTRIRVVFSEPVFAPLDNPLDWKVESFPEDVVVQVTGSGAERFLHLNLDVASSLDEDATPNVRYEGGTLSYVDRAKHDLGQQNRPTARALDRVPPVRIPEIDEIAGQAASGPVHATDPGPTVTVGNLRPGHVAEIYHETDGAPGRSDGDPLMGEAVADDDGAAEVALAEQIDPDGEHRLHVAARDPSGNRTDGDAAATYVLDRVAPAASFAAITEPTSIHVAFTEGVLPEGGNPAEWAVSLGVPVTEVSGSGSERTLTLGAPISPDAETTVSHVPVDGYADRAGNALAGFTITAFNGIPPEVEVTVPLTKIWTSASSTTLRGRAVGADRVELFPEQAAGTADAEPLTTASVGGDGGFQAAIGLPEDGEYELLVRGVRGTDPEVVGPFVNVPTIVRDTAAPAVQLQAPQEDDLVAGGSTVDIRWLAEDPNIGPGAIRIERSVDDGASWALVAGAETNDGHFAWEAPMVNTSAAKIRIRAADRAGNHATSVSGAFRIDATAPRFSATTLDQGSVRVRFTEPVVGSTGPQDWRIAGRLPQNAVTVDEADDGGIRALVLHTAPAHQIGRNERPPITYKPPTGPMTDRAGNRVPLDDPEGEFPALDEDVPLPRLTVVASDGIAPTLLGVDVLPSFVNRKRIAITGTAEAEGNRAYARRVSPKGPYSSTVNPDETFAVTVGLVQNRKNVFDVKIEDPSGNTSETRRIVIREDSKRPRVRVMRPRGPRIRVGRNALIRWRSRERYKDRVKIVYQIKMRRGVKTKVITKGTRDDGAYRWRGVPRNLRGKRIRILVLAYDRANNRGHDYSRWMRGR